MTYIVPALDGQQVVEMEAVLSQDLRVVLEKIALKLDRVSAVSRRIRIAGVFSETTKQNLSSLMVTYSRVSSKLTPGRLLF